MIFMITLDDYTFLLAKNCVFCSIFANDSGGVAWILKIVYSSSEHNISPYFVFISNIQRDLYEHWKCVCLFFSGK